MTTSKQQGQCPTCESDDPRFTRHPGKGSTVHGTEAPGTWRCPDPFHTPAQPVEQGERVWTMEMEQDWREWKRLATEHWTDLTTAHQQIEELRGREGLQVRRGQGLNFLISGPFIHGELEATPAVDFRMAIDRERAAEAKIEELTRERDELKRQRDHPPRTYTGGNAYIHWSEFERQKDRTAAAEAQRDTLREGIEEHRRYSTRDGREPDKAAHEDVRLYALLSTPPTKEEG